MSSTNKTSLGLNMWEASDKPVRQDFVNDNVIIDEKITKLNSDLSELKIVIKAFVAKSNTNEFVVFDTGEIPGGVFMVNCQVVNGIDDSHIVIGCYLNKAHQWIAKTDRTPGITVGIAVKAIAFAYK